eukprot:TRINITY_DN30281_c0_g1_i1.p1 TRINITY_DN30281_c0_g1~~TRINITY_DN30281_c0_g1_i1.p1  ORF type:complete len:264 (-),score=25.21 TRINITY_DN30281_c0_g1_i1:79-804(-)
MTLTSLLDRCRDTAHYCSASEAILILQSICLVGSFSPQLTYALLQQVSKVPRSLLSESEDNALHQVMLSLIHDPCAADALKSLRSSPKLWEACYRPEEVLGETASGDSGQSPGMVVEAQLINAVSSTISSANITLLSNSSIAGFYRLPILLHSNSKDQGLSQSGTLKGHALDVDMRSPPWLHETLSIDLWQKLKQRHLQLWNISLTWLRPKSWPSDESSRQAAVQNSVNNALDRLTSSAGR